MHNCHSHGEASKYTHLFHNQAGTTNSYDTTTVTQINQTMLTIFGMFQKTRVQEVHTVRYTQTPPADFQKLVTRHK
jgi:hypothetical protein